MPPQDPNQNFRLPDDEKPAPYALGGQGMPDFVLQTPVAAPPKKKPIGKIIAFTILGLMLVFSVAVFALLPNMQANQEPVADTSQQTVTPETFIDQGELKIDISIPNPHWAAMMAPGYDGDSTLVSHFYVHKASQAKVRMTIKDRGDFYPTMFNLEATDQLLEQDFDKIAVNSSTPAKNTVRIKGPEKTSIEMAHWTFTEKDQTTSQNEKVHWVARVINTKILWAEYREAEATYDASRFDEVLKNLIIGEMTND